MKTLITAILALTIGSGAANASNKEDIHAQIEESVSSLKGSLPTKEGHRDLVRVSFTIDASGNLHVMDTNYSSEELRNEVVARLEQLKPQGQFETDRVYYYQFVFEKL